MGIQHPSDQDEEEGVRKSARLSEGSIFQHQPHKVKKFSRRISPRFLVENDERSQRLSDH